MRVTQDHPTPQPSPTGARFSTSVTSSDRSVTVQVDGEIDAASSSQMEAAILAAVEGGRALRLDLAGTTFIDSAGIRVLARALFDLRERGSELRLVAASPMAENILRITGILDVLKDPSP